MAQLVGYLAETIIDLNAKEASVLALAASQAAHALDDPRYNGYWDAQTRDQLYELNHGSATTRARAKWKAGQSERDTQQRRWCALATLLDPEKYPEGWNTHG
jgi:hypothetical protein